MHELSSSDWFGKFWNWFQMPMSKIKELTDIFINCGYLQPARSLMLSAEFHEQSELFIMSAFYHLGSGNLFCTFQAMCHISVLHTCKFFYTYLDAMVEMQDEYIKLPWNITEFQRISKTTRPPACLAVAAQ
jgi:hypothetical protein